VVYHTDQDPKRGAKPRLDREGQDDISMAGLRHHHGHAAGALTFHTANETAQAALRASQGPFGAFGHHPTSKAVKGLFSAKRWPERALSADEKAVGQIDNYDFVIDAHQAARPPSRAFSPAAFVGLSIACASSARRSSSRMISTMRSALRS
jgi:hypothetical protein